MTALILPFPPSLNGLFIDGRKRRAISKAYENWLVLAGAAVLQQRPKPVAGPFRLHVVLERPDRRARDLDNYLKAPLDLLVKTGVIEDDSRAQALTVEWSPAEPKKPGALRLRLEAA